MVRGKNSQNSVLHTVSEALSRAETGDEARCCRYAVEEGSQLCAGLRIGHLMALGQHDLVLHGMLPSHELGHPHLVAVGLKEETTDHVGEIAGELPALGRMAPELVQRVLRLTQTVSLARMSSVPIVSG